MNGSQEVGAGREDPEPAPLVLPETDSMSASQESCGREYHLQAEPRVDVGPGGQRNECTEGDPEGGLPETGVESIPEDRQHFGDATVELEPGAVPLQEEEALSPVGYSPEAGEEEQGSPGQETVESDRGVADTAELRMTSLESGEPENDQVPDDGFPLPPDDLDQNPCEAELVEPCHSGVEETLSPEGEQFESQEFKIESQNTGIAEGFEGSNVIEEVGETYSTEKLQMHDSRLPSDFKAPEFSSPDPYTLLESSEGDIQVNTNEQSSNNMAGVCQNDASMSTTIGVSEIMADTAAHGFSPERGAELPSMGDTTCEQESLHSDAPSYTGGQSQLDEQRFSYDGGSSYHDDVPIEEDEEVEEPAIREEQKIVNSANLKPTTPLYYATETPAESQLLTYPCTVQAGADVKELIAISSVSHAEPMHRAVITPIEDLVASEDVKLEHTGHEESPIPSFKDIVEDLERKNVVSHLQQQLQPGHHFSMPQQQLRPSDGVVLNPQTGETLGTNQGILNAYKSGGEAILLSGGQGDAAPHLNSGGEGAGGPLKEAKQSGAPRPVRNCGDPGGEAFPAGAGGSGTGGGSPPPSGLDRARQVISMPECQMVNLTVFMDRAQVCRRIRTRLNASEITEILFGHLSPAIDKDSVRVEIRGAATILDVSYFARSLTDGEDTWSPTIHELRQELRQCQRQAENLITRINRTEKQRMILDTFADSLSHRDEEMAAGLLATVTPTASGQTANHTSPGEVGMSPSGAPTPLLSGNEHKGSMENQETLRRHKGHCNKAQMPPVLQSPQVLQAPSATMPFLTNPYDPRHMDTLHRFLTVYEEQAERLDATLLDTSEELEQVRTRIEAIQRELHDIELRQDEHLTRELSVLVEPRETGHVEMLVSYVVGRCSWRPAYDIRIFNSDGTMKIVYYGMVQQATGEDWQTKSMTLSTTLPGTGGTVPQLGTQCVHFRRETSPAYVPPGTIQSTTHLALPPGAKMRSVGKLAGGRRSTRNTTTSFNEVDGLVNNMDLAQKDTSTPVPTLQRGTSLEAGPHSTFRSISAGNRILTRRALGSSMLFTTPSTTSIQHLGLGGVRSTTAAAQQQQQPASEQAAGGSGQPTSVIATVHLDVPRPPGLIKCDDELVRVTVSLLDLQPRYEYVTVPKRSLHAYLKATAVNRSEFSILAGQTNIYADNTFIGKSEIGPVAQGEEFSCHLGAEHGIKVAYKPLCKYREGSGSSGKHATLVCKQLIEVRNTFDRQIHLMVVDQVPISGEDKIKVNLLEPTIKHPEKYDRNKPIRMNKSNNVEWDLDLGPGETKELTLKYSIDHPASEDLDVSVSRT